MKFSFDLEGQFPLNFSLMGEFDLSLSRFLRPEPEEETEGLEEELDEDRDALIQEVMKISSLDEIPRVDFGCIAGHVDEEGLPTVFICYGAIPLDGEGEERKTQESCISYANTSSAVAAETLIGVWDLHGSVYKFSHEKSHFIFAVTYTRTSLDDEDEELIAIDEETANEWVESCDADEDYDVEFDEDDI